MGKKEPLPFPIQKNSCSFIAILAALALILAARLNCLEKESLCSFLPFKWLGPFVEMPTHWNTETCQSQSVVWEAVGKQFPSPAPDGLFCYTIWNICGRFVKAYLGRTAHELFLQGGCFYKQLIWVKVAQRLFQVLVENLKCSIHFYKVLSKLDIRKWFFFRK